MTNHADSFAPGWPEGTTAEVEPTTVENLMAHFKRYGLDNSHTGYKKAAQTYKGYASLRQDALVHVGRSGLGLEAYLQLLDLIGYGGWAKAATADWAKLHGVEVDADAV